MVIEIKELTKNINYEFDINIVTKQILELKNKTAENIIEIGKKLKQVKENSQHGEFIKYLEDKVDFTRQTANKFMKIADEFTNVKATCYLGTEKLYMLTTIPKEEREEFLQNNDIKNMSTRELNKEIKKIKEMKKERKKPIETQETDSNIITPVEIKVTTDPVNDIWVDTITLKNKIKLHTGSFYNDINSNLQLTDYESLLVTRYLNNEITHSQLKQVIEQEMLNIPYMTNEEVYLKYLDDLDISNGYNHLEYNEETKKYDRYYDVFESHDLNYENVVLFTWEINEKDRQDYIENNLYCFSMDNITIANGYVETEEYICIYRDKKIFAHYDVDSDYKYHITNLFKFYKINKKYLDLVDKFSEQKEKERLEQLEEKYKNSVKNARFKFIKENETYLLSEYATTTDYIRVFIGHEEIAHYAFNIGMNLYSEDFYNTVSMGIYVNELIKKANDNNYNVLMHIHKFHKELRAKAKELHDQFKKKYSNFNWDDFGFGNFKLDNKDVTLDIFTEEEQKLLKEILNNEKIAKKLYLLSAMEYHPDKVATKSKEEKQQAETKMKLLNAINSKIAG